MDWEPERQHYGGGPAAHGSRALAILNASIPLFRAAGVRVKLHWSFFLAVLFFAGWTAGEAGWSAKLLVWGFVQAAILYTLVLLHEFSHATAAAMKGRPAREIVLTPLGGTAVIDRAMANPGMEAEVAVAGPALNLVILAASMVVVAIYGFRSLEAWAEPLTFGGALRFAFWANLWLALFNLTPAYPLDGGRMLRAFLAWSKGERRGTRVACRVGEVASVVFIGVGIWQRGPMGWILAGIGIMNILACETTIRMLGLGYGVYEDVLPEHGVRPGRPRETAEERRERDREGIERRLDELLDKVSREGMESLTFSEKRFLRRASRHYREK